MRPTTVFLMRSFSPRCVFIYVSVCRYSIKNGAGGSKKRESNIRLIDFNIGGARMGMRFRSRYTVFSRTSYIHKDS